MAFVKGKKSLAIIPVVKLIFALQLPALYNDILNHPGTSDELRRATESKLIRYKQQLFLALPSTDPEKRQVGMQLDEMVHGIVTIGIPDEFAWCIWFEGRDSDTVGTGHAVKLAMNTEFDTPEGLGLAYLKQFIELFPTSTLALMLTGYFAYSKTVHDNEGSTEELTLAVDRDPYGIILASSRITLQKISLTTLFRMHFQHSRTHC